MAPPVILPARTTTVPPPVILPDLVPGRNLSCGEDIESLSDIDYLEGGSAAEQAGRLLRFCKALTYEGCDLTQLPDHVDGSHLQLLYDNATCSNNILSFIQCCLLLFVCLLVIIVNTVMIYTIIKHKHLHCVTNWLLLSLATSDLLFGVSSMYTPVMSLLITVSANALKQDLMERYIEIKSNHVLCLLLDGPGVGFATMTASLLSLLALAVEKYVAVFNPFRHTVYMNTRTVILMAVVIWVTALTFGALPVLGWNTYDGVCAFVERTSYSYLITWTAICLVAAIIILVLYLRIFWIARKHATQIRNTIQYLAKSSANMCVENSQTGPTTMGTEGIAMAQLTPPPKRRFTMSIPNSPMRAVKTIGIILGCFYCCWLPLLIYFIGFQNYYSNLVIHFLLLVALCNSLCNPFIYGVRNRAIREAIACCLWKPKPEDRRGKALADVKL